jgi:predicted nucleic acid-binding protein
MLALVLEERHTERVASLVTGWIEEGKELHAPLVAQYEIVNSLVKKRAAKAIGAAKADTALAAIENLVVSYDTSPNMARAIEIALEMGRTTKSNDAFYVELAERIDTTVWTFDRALANNDASRHRATLID